MSSSCLNALCSPPGWTLHAPPRNAGRWRARVPCRSPGRPLARDRSARRRAPGRPARCRCHGLPPGSPGFRRRIRRARTAWSAGEYFKALSSRFTSTCAISTESMSTSGDWNRSRPGSHARAWPRPGARMPCPAHPAHPPAPASRPLRRTPGASYRADFPPRDSAALNGIFLRFDSSRIVNSGLCITRVDPDETPYRFDISHHSPPPITVSSHTQAKFVDIKFLTAYPQAEMLPSDYAHVNPLPSHATAAVSRLPIHHAPQKTCVLVQ